MLQIPHLIIYQKYLLLCLTGLRTSFIIKFKFCNLCFRFMIKKIINFKRMIFRYPLQSILPTFPARSTDTVASYWITTLRVCNITVTSVCTTNTIAPTFTKNLTFLALVTSMALAVTQKKKSINNEPWISWQLLFSLLIEYLIEFNSNVTDNRGFFHYY